MHKSQSNFGQAIAWHNNYIIAGSISKPIASIFLSEEHFLTLDKEVRNLYSFSPLKC